MRQSEHYPLLGPLREEDFTCLLSKMPGGVMVVDVFSQAILFQNQEALVLLGQPAHNPPTLQTYLQHAIHPNGRAYASRDYPLAHALRGQPVENENLLYQRPDGRRAYFVVNAFALRQEQGVPLQLLYHFRDRSALQAAQADLQHTRECLELALHGARVSLWEMDLRTGTTTADERIYAILGIVPNDQQPPHFNTWLSLLHPDDKDAALGNWFRYLNRGGHGNYSATYRMRTGSGHWKWLAIHAQVLERDARQQPVRVAGTFLDINNLKQAEMSARDSAGLLRATLHYAAIGLATLTPSGQWMRINPKLESILGYDCRELQQVGMNVIHPSDQPAFERQLEGLLSGAWPSFTLEQRYLCKSGKTIWATLSASTITDEKGRIKWLLYALEDTHVKKQAELKLARTQLQLNMATQIAQLGFWEWEPETDYCYFSAEWKAMLGYRDDELPDRYEEWERRLHPDEPLVLQRLQAYLKAPHADYQIEFRMRHKDGSYRWIAARAIPQFDQSGKMYRLVGTHLDITEEKRTREAIRQQAQHDVLTGLPNRGLLYEFGEQIVATARRSSKPLAVLFFDLDRFKAVNDTYGHQAGDAVLREVARRLSQIRRAEDVTGRLGGDEFVTILPNIRSKEDVVGVALKALERLRQPYLIQDLSLELSPSIGISLYPEDGQSIDTLIERADAAMYAVKQNGCNDFRFAHDPYNQTLAALRHPLELPLQGSLARQEFELVYQPLFNTRLGTVQGVEALVRWKPGASGVPLAGPDIFIPVAEACGLIGSIGRWVLQQACRQHQAWQEAGLPMIPIAVNVSLLHLLQQGFVERVAQTVLESGIDPACLELELKASAVLKHFEHSSSVLHALKAQGLRISLDECNLEHMNLRQIGALPLDRMKFQHAMLEGLHYDKTSAAIANATFAFGHALGAQVAVQGIESDAALQALRDYDCELGQGFYLGRPMGAGEFAHWYRQRALH